MLQIEINIPSQLEEQIGIIELLSTLGLKLVLEKEKIWMSKREWFCKK